MSQLTLAKRIDRMLAATGVRFGGCRFPYFHRLGTAPIAHPLTGTSEYHTEAQFEAFIKWFATSYVSISPDQWVAFHQLESAPPSNAAILSFDDGYADNFELAEPILQRYDVQATFFIAASIVGTPGGMSVSQVRDLHALGHTIGAHTNTHKPLAKLPAPAAREELLTARKTLEDMVGAPCFHMSYPYGSCNDSIADLVAEAGYKTAFTTEEFGNQRHTDLMRLGRTKIWPTDMDEAAFSVRMRGVHEWRNLLKPANSDA